MNEKYNITMQTPMGVEKGTITFVVDGDVLSGSLNIVGEKNDFSNGKLNENKFKKRHKLVTLFLVLLARGIAIAISLR